MVWARISTMRSKQAPSRVRNETPGVTPLAFEPWRDNRASCILELLESRRRLVRGCVVVEDVKSWLHERYR